MPKRRFDDPKILAELEKRLSNRKHGCPNCDYRSNERHNVEHQHKCESWKEAGKKMLYGRIRAEMRRNEKMKLPNKEKDEYSFEEDSTYSNFSISLQNKTSKNQNSSTPTKSSAKNKHSKLVNFNNNNNINDDIQSTSGIVSLISSPPNGPNQIPHKKRRTISLSSTDSEEDYNQPVNIIPNVKLKPNIEIKIIDQEKTKSKSKNGPIVISSDDDDSNEITTNTSSSHSKSQNYSKNSNNNSKNSNYFANEELNQAEINFFISLFPDQGEIQSGPLKIKNNKTGKIDVYKKICNNIAKSSRSGNVTRQQGIPVYAKFHDDKAIYGPDKKILPSRMPQPFKYSWDSNLDFDKSKISKAFDEFWMNRVNEKNKRPFCEGCREGYVDDGEDVTKFWDGVRLDQVI